jgi:peptidoglycan hydrolase-like protein with peptidoglycan-binding domain
MMHDSVSSLDIYVAPIHWLQRKLNVHWTDDVNLAVDGWYGPKSVAMVKKFQSQHKDLSGVQLVADGIVGPKTWAKLQTVTP